MTCRRSINVLLIVTSLSVALVTVALPAAPAQASGGAHALPVAGGVGELRQRIEDRARQLLAVARKGRSWVTPRGVTRWPILIQDELRGSLWENVDLQSLTFGDHWRTGDSARLELMHDGRVVGMLWIDHD